MTNVFLRRIIGAFFGLLKVGFFVMYFFINLIFLFIFSLAILFSLRKSAQYVGLVDKPNERKLHSGNIPLVGGLSICISILYFIYNNPEIIPNAPLYAFAITILVFVGVLDDKFDISFKFRLLVQASLAIMMMDVASLQLYELGNMFGFGHVFLPFGISHLITIFAVIGAINAFNMVDGIDGLLGGLASVTFAALAILFYMHGSTHLASLCVVFIVVMLPYIMFNLGIFGRKRKVFMGDAGSMLIGFTVIWLLMLALQPIAAESTAFRPVTALWLIGVPLIDMAAIMIRRVRRGDSPFKPDREHLHHIFQRLGLNSKQTLLTICSVAMLFAAVGIYGELAHIPEAVMFYGFIITFTIYAFLLAYIWRITAAIRSYSKSQKTPEKRVEVV